VGAPPSLDVLHVVLCGHVVVPLRLVVEENSQHAGVDREGFDEGVLEGEVGVEILAPLQPHRRLMEHQ
jgi:hypothetical protein